MSYFRTKAESLHLALSEDGLDWRALNNNKPVYSSEIGARSIRDPFLLRDQQGTFHLLSTNSWKSNTIFHAQSEDLIRWRNAQLIGVMQSVPDTRNCWAPEAFFDAESGVYRLIWSSHVPGAKGELDPWGYNQRIWGCVTRDWQTFGPPQLFFDPGHNTIDACVAPRPAGGYLMAFKDERGGNERPTLYKAMRVATADSAQGPWTIQQEFVTPPLTEGPTLFRAPVAGGADDEREWRLIFDCFMDGFFGCVASADGLQWRDISAQVHFPVGPRHASVIEIEAELASRLAQAWEAA